MCDVQGDIATREVAEVSSRGVHCDALPTNSGADPLHTDVSPSIFAVREVCHEVCCVCVSV